MAIILDGGSGITTPHFTSAAGIDATTLTGIISSERLPSIDATALTGTVSSAQMPVGSVLQIKFINSNYAWGSVGHSLAVVMPWLDITMTAKSTNPTVLISAQYASDDTNSSAYGVGIGSGYTVNGGALIMLLDAANHEDYMSVGSDTYFVARHTTAFNITCNIGDTLVFRVYQRFNNSNGQQFLGNGGTYYGQRHVVQEIRNV